MWLAVNQKVGAVWVVLAGFGELGFIEPSRFEGTNDRDPAGGRAARVHGVAEG